MVVFINVATFVVYEPMNQHQLIIETQMLTHIGRPDSGKRGKKKQSTHNMYLVDDEAGVGILIHDKQWSVFSLHELILWGLANRKIISPTMELG